MKLGENLLQKTDRDIGNDFLDLKIVPINLKKQKTSWAELDKLSSIEFI